MQLSLYNNLITKIEGLDGCPLIQKLYLEGNRISRLEGLVEQRYLEELNLSNQKIPDGDFFSFDDYSVAAISGSLQTLDINNASINDP